MRASSRGTTTSAPVLAWLKATYGDASNPQYWTSNINTWAFGVGAIIGTEGTDILLNMKGMILLELPGPRLLIIMKARAGAGWSLSAFPVRAARWTGIGKHTE